MHPYRDRQACFPVALFGPPSLPLTDVWDDLSSVPRVHPSAAIIPQTFAIRCSPPLLTVAVRLLATLQICWYLRTVRPYPSVSHANPFSTRDDVPLAPVDSRHAILHSFVSRSCVSLLSLKRRSAGGSVFDVQRSPSIQE